MIGRFERDVYFEGNFERFQDRVLDIPGVDEVMQLQKGSITLELEAGI